MITLLRIEYKKLAGYVPFWVLMGIHYGLLFICLASLTAFAEQFEFNGLGFTFSNEVFYGYPDIWQNLAYFSKFFAIFLAILVITSVTNEYTYRTNRQNIIDGLSRSQFITSKVLLVFALAIFGGVFVWLSGTLLGLGYAKEPGNYFQGMEFLPAYVLSVAGLYTVALLFAVLIRKASLSILALLGYITIMQGLYAWKMPDAIRPYLPLKAFGSLVPESFRRYVPIDTESIAGEIIEYVPIDKLIASGGWLVVLISLCYYIESRRDL